MKRFLLWSSAILCAVVITVGLAFMFSPWPSVAVIAYMISEADAASEAALARHVPAGIAARRGIRYGPAKDELLDVYYREGTHASQPAVVWVHGGGFVAGSKEGIANYLKILAGHGYTTIAVEYSKGFGARYPRPVEQVNAALGFIVRKAADLKVDPTMLVLAGDSAGAHIAGQVALITTNAAYAHAIGIPPRLNPDQLSAMLLLSGAYDPSAVDFEGEFSWFLKTVLWAYTGARKFREDERLELASVPSHVTESFPPSFISSGNGDPLAPQAVALAQKLVQHGVRIETLFFPPDRRPALGHEYQFNLDDRAGQEALERILAFLGWIRERAAVTSPEAGAGPKRHRVG